ncbi:MAG: hypothetical protein R2720_02335 [Candidatus Nanopelagicales bacterium]
MDNITTFPDAPVPDEKELRSRTNVLVQGWRFAILNMKMVAMITKGHH